MRKATWQRVRLRQLVRAKSGGTPPRGRDEFWSGVVPWVTAKDMKSFAQVDAAEHISEAAVTKYRLFVPPNAVLILVRGMTLLKRVPISLTTRGLAINQDVRALVPVNGGNGRFIAWMLTAMNQRLMALVSVAGHGTGRLGINDVLDLEVDVPDARTQRLVTSALEAVEHQRLTVANLLDAKRRFKRGVTQRLLTGTQRFGCGHADWRSHNLAQYLTESRDLASSGAHARKLTVKLYGRGVVAKSDARPGSANTQYH